ncbi:hypothetical protein FB480_101882 [Agrobacterium vitis]|nr:hypothetical protein FB480_101882 [Agrobacterium vitis]
MKSNVWTPSKVDRAADLWKSGRSASEIASVFDVSRNAVIGLATRNRDRFPERRASKTASVAATPPVAVQKQKPKTSIDPASAINAKMPRRSAPVPSAPSVFDDLMGGPEAKRDLSRFQLPDAAPVPFAQLNRGQCKFMLIAFDAAAGPDSPCCGADTSDSGPWCDQHKRVVFKARVTA